MKRFFAVFVTLYASLALGATLSPVQLMNPAGSTAGQTIVSTGASSAPGWAAVPLSGLSSIAANTVLGNFTGASASPLAFSMPSCSTASSILQYTSGGGFTCSTTTWASPPAIGGTTAAAGAFTTLSASGAFTPSQTAGIVGTTTNNNANAGSVGEFPNNSATSVSLTASIAANCTSISLTAGDYDVSGTTVFIPAGSTVPGSYQTGISTTSATLPASEFDKVVGTATYPAGSVNSFATPTVRISIASTTTVYLIGLSSFTTSTMVCDGRIRARRLR